MVNKTSADFSRLITNQSITIGFDGDTKTVMKESNLYDKLLLAIKEERWDDIPGLLTPETAVASMSNGDMRVEGGQVYVKIPSGENFNTDFAVPSGLNSTILFYIENNLPFQPLVKFAVNLSMNPSYRSVQQLFTFLEKNNFTITEDGKFIAYKSVKEDFMDVHSGKYDNSVGNVVSMPRNQVNEDPEQTCSYGLHVANYDYAHNVYGGPVTVFVEVNPKDVVAVPMDYNNAKMRVCEYKVLGVSKGEIKDPIYKTTNMDLDDVDVDLDDEEDACGEIIDREINNFCSNCGEEI